MARPITARMAQALLDHRPIGLIAEIEHPSADGGIARYWSGIGTLQYNGFTWTGAGKIGGVTPIKQSSEIAIQEINFTLVGVDPIETAKLSDEVRNLAGRVWLICLDDANQVVPDPYLLIDAELDYQTFTVDDNGVASISITANTGFYTLERGIDEAWTPENQKQAFPDDSGLDMIPGLQNQDIQWTQT